MTRRRVWPVWAAFALLAAIAVSVPAQKPIPGAGALTPTFGLPVAVANGGTGTASTLTGLVRGSGSAMTAAELSGDVTTSASNATTVAKVSGTLASYNGINLVGNGLASIVAKVDATAQTANITATTVYAVPGGGAGMYRMSCYTVVTTAATTSSVLPNCYMVFTDADTSAVQSVPICGAPAGNTVGLIGIVAAVYGSCEAALNAAASTNIQYKTLSYTSVGGTAMQYAVHVKLQYLGN